MRIKQFLPFLDQTRATQATPTATAPVYQFTIVSVGDTLNALRKQLYYELRDLDLRVLAVRISRAESDQLASTVVTLHCPPTCATCWARSPCVSGRAPMCAACTGNASRVRPLPYCRPEAGSVQGGCREAVMKDPYKTLMIARVVALALIWLAGLLLVLRSIWRLP